MPLVYRVAIVAEVHAAVCQLYLRLWDTTLAKKKLCGHKAYMDTWYVLLYIIDKAGGHNIDFVREGFIND